MTMMLSPGSSQAEKEGGPEDLPGVVIVCARGYDAVCNNPADNDEKSSQIPLMQDVYSFAKSV